MLDSDRFFLIFIFTILIVRTALFLHPFPSPTVKNFRFHHWMYGVAIITISFFTSSGTLLAIGVGLFVDELTFLLIKGRTHEDNYSIKSLAGTAAFIMLSFLFREQLFGGT
jgi:hypothetical protein